MNITFAPRNILQIDNSRIVFRNFSGEPSKYNREGDRNFAVVIPDRVLNHNEVDNILDIYKEAELVKGENGDVLMIGNDEIITVTDALIALGWNVRIKAARDVDDSPFMYLPIKIKFNDRGPGVYLKTGKHINKLDEESIDCLDDIDISSVDMDIRPYDWEVNGNTGRTAYLQSIHVTQEVDRFAARFAAEEYPEE